MSRECYIEAENFEEALSLVLEELGVDEDQIEYESTELPEMSVVQIKAWTIDDADIEDDGKEFEDFSDEYVDSDDVSEDMQEQEDEPFEPSEEDLDKIADTAIEVLRSILSYFGAEDATIDEYEGDEGEILLDIIGDDLAVLIGRHGKTLDALQLLVTSITNRRLEHRYPVVVDVGGYKYRRRQKLEGIARSAASRAVKQKRDIHLRPMSPYERRIVHITLRDNPKVTTMSEGEDPQRMVVIKPVR